METTLLRPLYCSPQRSRSSRAGLRAASVLAQEGQELAVNGPPALAEFHRTEVAKWHRIIVQLRESGIVLE